MAAFAKVLPSLKGKTARSWRGIVPFTHLAREGRMTVTIGRRELLAALGGAAAAWPLAARAQPAMPVIGFLNSGTREGFAHLLAAFHQSLNQAGFVEGRNLAIEYRWAEGQYERLPALAADLVRRQVTLMAATTTPAALAVTALPGRGERRSGQARPRVHQVPSDAPLRPDGDNPRLPDGRRPRANEMLDYRTLDRILGTISETGHPKASSVSAIWPSRFPCLR